MLCCFVFFLLSHPGLISLSLADFVSLPFSPFHLIIRHLSLATAESITAQTRGGVEGRKEGWRQIAGDYSSTLADLVPFFNRPAWIRRLRYTLLIHVSRSHPQLARSLSHAVVCTMQNRADKTFKSAGLYLQDCICITIVYLCLKGLWRIAFLITEHKRKSLQSEMYYFFKDPSGVTAGMLNPPPNSIQSFSSRFAKVLEFKFVILYVRF